jgi:surface-anchored protein
LPSNDGTTRAQKTKWLDDLIKTQVLPLYDIDKTRVCLAGFSSGAENVAGIYGPLYAASWMEDGLLLAISYGSSPDQYGITDTYTSDFRAKVAAVWDVRGGDTTTALADSLEGYNWYGTEGFTTRERNVIPGGEHDRPGEFGTIVDGYLTEYVRASTTRAGGTSGTKLEAAQAILARLEDPLDAGDFFEDWTYDGMPAVVGEWNDELLADYEAATGPYEFPGDIESGQVQAWLQSFIDAQTGGGGGDPGPVGSPTISAGADVTLSVGEEFTRIATEEDNGAAITSRSWSITSGPAGVGTTMSLTATVTWQFTKPGTYVVAYQATNSLGTAVDTATITVTAAGAGSGHWPKTSGWFTLQR